MNGRVVLHSDLNNCYASIECMLHPELKGKYIAVCGSTEDRHGIVLAKNQLAKQAGVKTGEAIWQARQKCPQLTIVQPHMDQYLKFSKIVRSIYLRYSPDVEAFGIDESWIELTGSARLRHESPTDIANGIRETVKSEVGLTVSVGVSYNKIFAKLGSDMKKPDAVTAIWSEDCQKRSGLCRLPNFCTSGGRLRPNSTGTRSIPSGILPEQIPSSCGRSSASTARSYGSMPTVWIPPASCPATSSPRSRASDTGSPAPPTSKPSVRCSMC